MPQPMQVRILMPSGAKLTIDDTPAAVFELIAHLEKDRDEWRERAQKSGNDAVMLRRAFRRYLQESDIKDFWEAEAVIADYYAEAARG